MNWNVKMNHFISKPHALLWHLSAMAGDNQHVTNDVSSKFDIPSLFEELKGTKVYKTSHLQTKTSCFLSLHIHSYERARVFRQPNSLPLLTSRCLYFLFFKNTNRHLHFTPTSGAKSRGARCKTTSAGPPLNSTSWRQNLDELSAQISPFPSPWQPPFALTTHSWWGFGE